MDGETITLSSSNSDELKRSVGSVSILVVDDDTTCLSIVAAILKKFKYEVVTVKHPSDALCTLRIKGGAFDLVVSDVHMPDMNGFDLQQAIAQEFHLPVVLMSADEEEGLAVKGLENGAAYFIMKPVSPDDLRDLWQFASMKKKSKVVIEESHEEEESSTGKNNSNEIAVSAGSVSEEIVLNKRKSKKKYPRKEGSGAQKGESSQSGSQKRTKITWTNSLHNRFLEAIRSIGLDRAVPKKILEVMNVPGLTRENVASHLQKYRIFLRRVSDASYKVQHPGDHKGFSRNFGPTFESSGLTNPSTLILNRIRQSQSPPGTHVAPMPNQASSSNLITQSGFGQSRLLGSSLKPNVGNTNLTRQNDRLSTRLVQNNYQTFTSAEGNLLEDLSSGISTSIVMNLSGGYQVLPRGSIGTSSTITSIPSNFTHGTNYVGYSISNIKHLAESGHGEIQPNATTRTDENINVDQLSHYVGASSSFGANNNGGGQLSDIIAAYRVLAPSNPTIGPTFGLSEFGNILSGQPHSLEDSTLDAQGNIQSHTQENRGETITSTNFYGGMSHLEIVPAIGRATNQEQITQGSINSQEFGTHTQINETAFLPPNQCVAFLFCVPYIDHKI
ncbi:hypothetical protein CDL12_18827 [Handroanthus impetiginosus]|uniref:Response regulatory domain-containing protein n=1 Tax=Handroanthus impetiginosus TaxID=429701 RepID=A0A2G9GTH6_9LAMI|nr:hypothetical protein CDL12_18827 [Handroanthus impetiginosus]